MITFQELPIDLLLAIINRLEEPEECFSLIQTCRATRSLIFIKSFWIHVAALTQRRRRVHSRPFEHLQIDQLRHAIFSALRLELKWSGILQPDPIRSILLEPKLDDFPTDTLQAVTWSWFVDDGVHLLCVVDDSFIQLWNLPLRRVCLKFPCGGYISRASQYVDDECYVFMAYVRQWRLLSDVAKLKIWKYNWATQKLELVFDHRIEGFVHHSFITDAMAGLSITDMNEAPIEDQFLTFFIVDWRTGHHVSCRAPITYFASAGPRITSDEFSLIRQPDRILLFFEWTLIVKCYTYSMHRFYDLLSKDNPTSSCQDNFYPESCQQYAFACSEEGEGLPRGTWNNWGRCALWDGRVGTTSQITHDNTQILALSLFDPASSDAVFTRAIVYPVPNGVELSVSPADLVFLSQPKAAKASSWAIRYVPEVEEREDEGEHQEGEIPARPKLNQIDSIILAQFPTIEASKKALETMLVRNHWPENYNFDTPIKPVGKLIEIGVKGWLPKDDRVYDLDMDDTRGRIAAGLESGKVLILEFV